MHVFTIFCGKYVDVDIFFVISGYLITYMILLDHEKGTFKLINFYERHTSEILPGLLLVLCLAFLDVRSAGKRRRRITSLIFLFIECDILNGKRATQQKHFLKHPNF